jgi:hypothetical protein
MEKPGCHHTVSIEYFSSSCNVIWHWYGPQNPPKMMSFVSAYEAWEFAVSQLRQIFYDAYFRDYAINLEEQCSKCGRTPLNFIGLLHPK